MNYLALMQCSQRLSPINVPESQTSLTHVQSLNSEKCFIKNPDSAVIAVSFNAHLASTSTALSVVSSILSSTASLSSTSTSTSSLSSSSSDMSDFGFSILMLAEKSTDLDEKILLKRHGYTKEDDISSTAQGEIFLARKGEGEELVAIKKVPKDLWKTKELLKDDFTFATDKDIVKEGKILKSIAENKDPKNELMIKYLDFFASDENYYLVQEYVEDCITLKQFVIRAHQYITDGKLKLKHYKKYVTLIIYQLAIALDCLHNNHKCTHNNIVPENVLLKESDFIQNSDGSIDLNPRVQIKLKDFGVSEQYEMDNNTFECNKQFLSIDNEQYLAPDISEKDSYDSRGIDMWSLGMTAYFCYVSHYPFSTMEFTNDLLPQAKPGSGYWAVLNGKIRQHLCLHNDQRFVNSKVISVLNMLLNVDSDKRVNAENLLKHKLFSKFVEK